MAKPKVNEKILTTFLTNLDFAIRNNETVTIDGGEFTPLELKNVKLALEERKDLITMIQGIREL